MSTPHARGSTCQVCSGPAPTMVYPACAGIHPEGVGHANTRESLPRMRGDPPRGTRGGNRRGQSTLHARGSTWSLTMRQGQLPVYPACAGSTLMGDLVKALVERLPRMRGDPPQVPFCASDQLASTPHARGSTVKCCTCGCTTIVYPACAGIHRSTLQAMSRVSVYPACAGIHLILASSGVENPSLPRMRGDPPL